MSWATDFFFMGTKAPAPMKLHLLPEHVEKLQYPITSKKRAEKLQDIIAHCGGMIATVNGKPTAAFPTELETQAMHFVLPDEFDIAAAYDRAGQLNGITIQLGTEQRTFTTAGMQSTRFTMRGDGVGDTVEKGRVDTLKTLLGFEPIAREAKNWLRDEAIHRCKKLA